MAIFAKRWQVSRNIPYSFISVSPAIILGGRPAPPAPLEAQVHFISFYFLYSARSQQKSFKVTIPIEQVYTLFFY